MAAKDTFGKAFNQMQNIAGILTKHNDLLTIASDKVSYLNSMFEDLSDKAKNNLYKSLQKVNTALQKTSVGWLAAIGAMRGAGSAIKDVGSVFKKWLGGIGAIANTAFGYIDSFVGSVINGFKTLMTEIDAYYRAIRASIEGMQNNFGTLSIATGKMAKDFAAGASILGKNAYRYNDVLDAISEAVNGTGASFRRLGQQMSSAQRREFANTLAVLVKGLGLTGEQLDGLSRAALSTGEALPHLTQRFMIGVREMSEASGLSEKEISMDMAEMMTSVSDFGDVTVDMASRSVARLRSLGIEVNKVVGVVKKFDIFKDAALSVGVLAQVFDMQLDSYKLMTTHDPTERIDALRNALFQTGRSWEQMSRQEQTLLSEQVGLDMQTAKLAFSIKNQGDSWSDLEKKSKKALTPQEAMARTMRDLSRNIAPLTRYIPALIMPLDMLNEGIKRGLSWFGLSTDALMNLRQWYQKTFDRIIALTIEFVNTFPGVKDFFEGLRDIFKDNEFIAFINGIEYAIKDFIGGGAKDWEDLWTALSGLWEGFESGSTKMQQLSKGFKAFTKAIRDGIISLIDQGTEYVKRGIEAITEILTKGIVESAEGWSKKNPFFGPLLKSLGDAWEKLKDPLKTMMWAAFKEGLDLLWQGFKKFIKDNWEYIGYWIMAKSLWFGFIGGIKFWFQKRAAMTAMTVIAEKLGVPLTSGVATGGTAAATGWLSRFGATIRASGATIVRGITSVLAATGPIGIVIAAAAAAAGAIYYWKFRDSAEKQAIKARKDETTKELEEGIAELNIKRQTGITQAEELEELEKLYKSHKMQVKLIRAEFVQGLIDNNKDLGLKLNEDYKINEEGHFRAISEAGKKFISRYSADIGINERRMIDRMQESGEALGQADIDRMNMLREAADKASKESETEISTPDIFNMQGKLDFIKQIETVDLDKLRKSVEKFQTNIVPIMSAFEETFTTFDVVLNESNLDKFETLSKSVDAKLLPLADKLYNVSQTFEQATLTGKQRAEIKKSFEVVSSLFNVELPNAKQVDKWVKAVGTMREYSADFVNVYNALNPGGMKINPRLAVGQRGKIDLNVTVEMSLDGEKFAQTLNAVGLPAFYNAPNVES